MSKINDFLKNLNKKQKNLEKNEDIDNLFDVSSSNSNIDPLK
jgi:hypothetical protein